MYIASEEPHINDIGVSNDENNEGIEKDSEAKRKKEIDIETKEEEVSRHWCR